jgi:hypothetical protein
LGNGRSNVAFIDQSLIRECNKHHSYCEPDEIRLPPVTEESKKEFYRIDMVRMFRALLRKRENKYMTENHPYKRWANKIRESKL